jgi:Flp pilus assembly pilin Flp
MENLLSFELEAKMRRDWLKRPLSLWQETSGASLVEYGMLMAFIVTVAVGSVSAFGQLVYTAFWEVITNAI